VNLPDLCRVSPLISAAHYGRLPLVRLLLAAPAPGCDPLAADEQGLTALHHAALKGHLSVVQFLMKHCSAGASVVFPPPLPASDSPLPGSAANALATAAAAAADTRRAAAAPSLIIAA
jgi:ankyrin repeat protein